MLALLLALALSTPPSCTAVQASVPMLEGRYALVTCPQGTLTVAVPAAAPVPAVGPSLVLRAPGTTTYRLLAGGVWYPIMRTTP